MNNKFIYNTFKKSIFLLFIALGIFSSCSKGKSYSELLREEEKATNWFLAQKNVVTQIPKDSIFIEGKDAPFYRMDSDGYLYMQVVNYGDTTDMVEVGDLVYFTYMRCNIKYLWQGYDIKPEGNANNMGNGSSADSFIYGNYQVSTSALYGTGIQVPLRYVGNHSEVNLVLRSYYGFMADQGECNPYIINLKYFKAEY